MIELKNITKEFSDIVAVKDVTLTVDKGDIFGIIGFSGAGKSTLLRCINLLERPTSGDVVIDNVNITGLSEKQLRTVRKKIGMIFQHFNLLMSRTVFENIAYPLSGNKQEINKKVYSLLNLVGLEDKETAYPSQLSGGQKQRVAIARALANDPKVLLCDEATSALDPQTTSSILKLLKQVNQKLGITIVLITHEMSVIKEICNKVAIMEHGALIETGEVFEVFSKPKENVTKSFIEATSSVNRIYDLISEKAQVVDLNVGEQILKLKYQNQTASEPLVSAVSRMYNIDLNIIFGSFEIVNGSSIGNLVVIISGKDIEGAIKYMQSQGVSVEVIKDAN